MVIGARVWQCHRPLFFSPPRFQVSAEPIRPAEPGLDPLDPQGPGAYRTRFAHMLRSIKSAGFNGLAILNVDACVSDNVMTLESASLRNISKNIGLPSWGISAQFVHEPILEP